MPGDFSDLIAGGPDGGARQIRCRCDRTCHCPAGAPCRCQSACRCGTASRPVRPEPVRTDLWAEAGEAELGARRGRAPSRPAPRPPRPPLPRGPAPVLQAQRQRQHQVEQARQRRRLQRLNQYFAWRFGWGRQLARIGQQLGCGPCLPGSLAFLTAMARWQRRHGLRVTGVLTPTLATWLLGTEPGPDPGLPSAADPAQALSAGADGADANPYGNPDDPEDPSGADGPADADDEFTFFGQPACGCR